MACTDGIAKNIVSDCTTSGAGGAEVTAYILNRSDVTITFDATNPSKITGLVNASTKQAYTLTVSKKGINAGHDIVVADDKSDRFTHYVAFKQFENLAADIENLDAANDIVVILEAKNKTTTGEGVFLAYGAKYGLYKSADTKRVNDDSSARSVEFASLADQEEPCAQYTVFTTDLATTRTLVEGLTTPGA